MILNHKVLLNPQASQWVVFVHGAGGSIQTWSRQVKAFEKHFNLLLIDLRDHGKSKDMNPHFDSYQFNIISDDIHQLLNHHKIDKAHFVTLSFGSVLMQDFSKRFPDKIEKLVFAGGIFHGGIAIRLFVYLAKALNVFLSYPSMYKIFSYLLMPKKSSQLARKLYQKQAKKISQREYMKWLGLYKEFFRLLRQFSSHTIPFKTLVIMGDQDYMFLNKARIFASRQQKAQFIAVPNSGHIVNIESADQFNRNTIRFLRS